MKKTIFKNFAIVIACLLSVLTAKGQANLIEVTPIASGDTMFMPAGIAFDKNDNLWMGANLYDGNQYNVLLFEYNNNAWQRYKIPNVLYSPVMAVSKQMVVDTNNVVYFCFETILRGFNIATQTDSVYYLNNLDINQVVVDRTTNTKWMTTDSQHSVMSWDGINFTVYDTLAKPGTFASDITTDNLGNVYVLFSSYPCYLLKFDGNQWIDYSTLGYPPMGDNFTSVCDNNNNLWICFSDSFGTALLKFDGTNFTTHRPPNNINLEVPTDMKCDKQGNIWLITGGGSEIIKYDGAMFTSYYIVQNFQEPNLGIDKASNIWIGEHTQIPGCYLFNEKGFKNISGNVFSDINQNGTRDVGENGISNEVIYTSDFTYALTDSVGNYSVAYIDSSQLCSINHVLKPYTLQTSIPASYNISPSTDPTTGIDFGINIIPGIIDFNISASLFPVRPGFTAYGNITCSNQGTTTMADTVTLTLDPQLLYASSSVIPISIAGNVIKWLTPALAQLNTFGIDFTATVNVGATINDTLISLISIGNSLSDQTPLNNSYEISSIVTGSFDPNEKEVHPIAHVKDDDPLFYTIHFQNTGTDTAFNIIIRDTLDFNLDPTTFNFISSSHLVIPELAGAGNLKFSFYNILLPDSNVNEPFSHGYISYSVRPKNNSQPGTLINNTAYIYFDYNAPIVTNTTISEIETPVGLYQVTAMDNFVIFPNPASDDIMVSAKQKINYYTLTTVSGSTVISQKINFKNNFQISLKELNAGVYFLKLYCNEGTLISKVLKY